MRTAILVMLALAHVCGSCRKPPAPTEPVPADAAPIPRDSGTEDAGPAQDGSVSECVALPDLTCVAIATAVTEAGETWLNRMDTSLDVVRDEVRQPVDASGGQLCGETSGRVVHYVGDDAQVHDVFRQFMDGWTSSPVVFDPDGRTCVSREDFERMGIIVRLETRRAQRSFSLQIVLAP